MRWQGRGAFGQDARAVIGKPTPLPRLIEPQIPVLVDTPPPGDDLVCELKADGFRCLPRKDGERVQLLSRSGKDLGRGAEALSEAIRALAPRTLYLDGELVVPLPDGTFNFLQVRSALSPRSGVPLMLYLFDCLFLDGEDLRERPLRERKRALKELLVGSDPSLLKYCDHLDGQAAKLFQHAQKSGAEGVVVKEDGPYVSGRSASWRKVRCSQVRPLVVGGYKLDLGGALKDILVGEFDGERLLFFGTVSQGLGGKTGAQLLKVLRGLEMPDAPFLPETLRGHGALWVRAEVRVRVKFTATTYGRMRHPSVVSLG